MQFQDPGRVVDIVFCIDVTGSMRPHIEDAKAVACDLLEAIHNGCQQAGKRIREGGLRVRLIQFRDLEKDRRGAMEDSDWISESRAFFDAVASMVARGGGGDGPESSLDAFLRACRVEWQPIGPGGRGRRVVILLTDANPLPLHASTRGSDQGSDAALLRKALEAANFFGLQGTKPFRGLIVAPEHEMYREIERMGFVKFVATQRRGGLADTSIVRDIVPWIVESI